MKKKNEDRLYTVHGITRRYSKEEIEYILEKWIPKWEILPEYFEEDKKPTYGKAFKVDLKTINTSLFVKERYNSEQESLRKTILQAISKALLNQEKYGSFYYLIPRREWVFDDMNHMTILEFINFSRKQNGWVGDTTTQMLVYAQQISNGDEWEEIVWNYSNNPELCEVTRDSNLVPIFFRGKRKIKKVKFFEDGRILDAIMSKRWGPDYDFYRQVNHGCSSPCAEKYLPAIIIKSLYCLRY